MFYSPGPMRSGPSAVQAAAEAGLPHAEVPGDLRTRVEQALSTSSDTPNRGGLVS